MVEQIARLDVIESDLDGRTARRRARRVLERMRLRPDGMPAAAILCVRHFEDPLPRTLPLESYRLRDLQRWQRAAEDELTRLYRGAYAPAREHVPPSANAVLFGDYADLLACLASDWLSGRLVQRWWWGHWIANRSLADAVHRAWLQDAVYVPAALARLTHPADFVRRVPDVVVARLLRMVVRAYALPTALLESVDLPVSSLRRASSLPTRAEVETPTLSEELTELRALRVVPEHAVLGLTAVQRGLLLVALALVRRPGLVRQSGFATVVKRRLRDLAISEREDAQVESARPQSIATPSPAEDAKPEWPEPRPAKSPSLRRTSRRTPAEPHASDTATFQLARGEGAHPDAASTQTVAAAYVLTGYGGLFYLVNVALFLGLYGDFSTPRELGLELPIWDFLALIGLAWFGEDFRDDALWPLLAELAGREPDMMPGEDIRVPEDWRVPGHWLDAFPELGIWRWQVAQGRLRVRHPVGFLLLDLPAKARLLEEVGRYIRPHRLERAPLLEAEVVNDWMGWVRRLLPYLEARLARALGREQVRELCRVSARISYGNTHLDLHMRLDDIDLDVRQAGLDRNPGWVPSAGRFIHFHFD